MNSKRLQVVGVFMLLVVFFGVGAWTGTVQERIQAQTTNIISPSSSITTTVQSGRGERADLSQFWKAWDVLEEEFVQTHSSSSLPTEQEKIYGAIEGLVASYDDPYTIFFPPQDAQIFNENVSGSFEGVGMEIDNDKDGRLIVISPLKGSPAERAGIMSGDVIVAIGATSTVGLASHDAVKIIRGPKGSTVKFTVLRKDVQKPISISVVRDTIAIPTINAYKRADGIFTIELYSFSANSANLFRDALRQFVQSGSRLLLLDVRGNPGGYLDAAVQMASFFLPVGDTIVTEDSRGKGTNVVHRSYGYNVFSTMYGFHMAILVDQGSASASEILAGALQQHDVATLVGTRTFGKGSVQALVDLGGGAELKVTVARWLTPNGSSISDGGLDADIKVERTQEDRAAQRDPQTDAAVKYLLTL